MTRRMITDRMNWTPLNPVTITTVYRFRYCCRHRCRHRYWSSSVLWYFLGVRSHDIEAFRSLETQHFPQDMSSTKDSRQLCTSKNVRQTQPPIPDLCILRNSFKCTNHDGYSHFRGSLLLLLLLLVLVLLLFLLLLLLLLSTQNQTETLATVTVWNIYELQSRLLIWNDWLLCQFRPVHLELKKKLSASYYCRVLLCSVCCFQSQRNH